MLLTGKRPDRCGSDSCRVSSEALSGSDGRCFLRNIGCNKRPWCMDEGEMRQDWIDNFLPRMALR